MAKTSKWFWSDGGIDKSTDVSTGYGTQRNRSNWTLTRQLTSDDVITSQQGETATSVTAVTGSITRTIEAPILTDLIGFNTNTNWCTTDQVWIPSGVVANGAPVYVPLGTNIPNKYAINALARTKIVDETAVDESDVVNYVWRVVEISPDDLSSIANVETITPDIVGYTYKTIAGAGAGTIIYKRYPYTNFAGVESESFDPVGLVIGGTDLEEGSFVGSATVVNKSAQMEFTCIQDASVPPTQGVEWYDRTQVWQYISPWS